MKKNTTFYLVSTLILLTLNLIAFAHPWEGSGTISDPYQIDSPADLIYLSEHNEHLSDNFKLTADIDLEPNSFDQAVIAPNGEEFDGLFDGNHHKILNMTINTQTSNADYLGLFGQTGTNADIRNLGLENVSITGGSSDHIGAIVGYHASSYEIVNCYATGSITTTGSGTVNIGGFIGLSQSTAIDCYADVDVEGGSSSQRLGGFVGYSLGSYSRCYASGSVSGSSNVNGFVGLSLSGLFLDCFHLHPNDGGGPVDSKVTVLTDAQMRDSSNFTNWDFFGETANGIDEIWMMDGYPALSWQIPVGFRDFSMLAQYWKETGFTQDQPEARADWYSDNIIDINDLNLLAASWLDRVVEKMNPLAPGDDFESGDFTKQPWILGGTTGWVIDDVTVQQGSYSAKSGTIGDSQSSYMELTVDTTGYDLITFYYKVSSQDGFDNFHFYIDGSWRIQHSGDSGGWLYRTFPVYDEVTTFRWSYDKDSSGSDGEDAAWVDNIVFIPES